MRIEERERRIKREEKEYFSTSQSSNCRLRKSRNTEDKIECKRRIRIKREGERERKNKSAGTLKLTREIKFVLEEDREVFDM